MNKPDFKRTRNTMQFLSEEDGYLIIMDRFSEARDDVRANVRVQEVVDGKPTGTLAWGNPGLASVRSRGDLAKECLLRCDRIDWPTVLLHCFDRAYREWNIGQPVIDLSEVRPPRDVAYLVKPILPLDETTVVFAAGGTGKSTLSRVLGLHVRLGRSIPGLIEPLHQTGVLILDWETNADAHARDLAKIAVGMGLESVPQIFYRECHRPLADEADTIAGEIAERNIGLVIIDSLAPACGDDPQAPGAATSTMNAIRSLGGTRLVLAHVTKDAIAGNSPGSIFGSVFFTNLARSVWELKAAAEPSSEAIQEIALFHRKVNAGPLFRRPIGLSIVHNDASIVVQRAEVNLDSSLSSGLSLPDQIRLALKKGAKTAEELSEELGARTDLVRTALHRMNGKDVVRLEGDGKGGKTSTRWGMLTRSDTGPIKADETCRYCSHALEIYDQVGTPLCENHRRRGVWHDTAADTA